MVVFFMLKEGFYLKIFSPCVCRGYTYRYSHVTPQDILDVVCITAEIWQRLKPILKPSINTEYQIEAAQNRKSYRNSGIWCWNNIRTPRNMLKSRTCLNMLKARFYDWTKLQYMIQELYVKLNLYRVWLDTVPWAFMERHNANPMIDWSLLSSSHNNSRGFLCQL